MDDAFQNWFNKKINSFDPEDECLSICRDIEKNNLSHATFENYTKEQLEELKDEMLNYFNNKKYHDSSIVNILKIGIKKKNFVNEYKTPIIDQIKLSIKKHEQQISNISKAKVHKNRTKKRP